MDQKYEMLLNSYNSLKIILSPNLNDDQINFMNEIIELIKTQINFYRKLTASNDPKEFFEMLNLNNQNLSKEIKRLFDHFINIVSNSARNSSNQKIDQELTISNGNNGKNEKDLINNNISKIKVKMQPKLNINEDKKLISNLMNANSISVNSRYANLEEKTEEIPKEKKIYIKNKSKDYFSSGNKSLKFSPDNAAKRDNNNNTNILNTSSKNKMEKKNLFIKNDIQKKPIKINLFDKNLSNDYNNENCSEYFGNYYTQECANSLNEKINNESEISHQMFANSTVNNLRNSAEIPQKIEKKNIFFRKLSDNTYSNSLTQKPKNQNSVNLIISIKHTNRLNNYLTNRKNKNLVKNEIVINEVIDDITNNKNNSGKGKHIIKKTNSIPNKKSNGLNKSKTKNKFSLDDFLIPCNNSKNGEKLFLFRAGRVIINNTQKEYLERIIGKSIISPEKNNNKKYDHELKYKKGKIEWGKEEQKNLGCTAKEMKEIIKLLEESLQNPVNLKIKNKQASIIDNELQAARDVISNYKKIKKKEKIFTKGNFKRQNSANMFKKYSKTPSTLRSEYFSLSNQINYDTNLD